MNEQRPSKPYKELLHARLQNPAEAVSHLSTCADEGDVSDYLLAVQDLFFALNPDARAALSALRGWAKAVRDVSAAVKRRGSTGQECFELGRVRDEKESALLAAEADLYGPPPQTDEREGAE